MKRTLILVFLLMLSYKVSAMDIESNNTCKVFSQNNEEGEKPMTAQDIISRLDLQPLPGEAQARLGRSWSLPLLFRPMRRSPRIEAGTAFSSDSQCPGAPECGPAH